MDAKEKTAVVLLGMAQSGVSVLEDCLERLGVPAGSRPAPGEPDEYPLGQAIRVQHEMLLKRLGCRWDMIGGLPAGWQEKKAVSEAGETLAAAMDRFAPDTGLISLSDPCMARFMPLWMRIFWEKRIRPCFVVLVRQPGEVARFLERDFGIDPARGHLLWLMHTREALFACSGHDSIVLTYEELLSDPVCCMEKTGSRLGIVFPRHPRDCRSDLIDSVQIAGECTRDGIWENTGSRYDRYDRLYGQFRGNFLPDRGGAGKTGLSLIVSPEADAQNTDTAFVAGIFDDAVAVLSGYEQKEARLENRNKRLALCADFREEVLCAHICFPRRASDGTTEYAADHSEKILLFPDSWQKLSVSVPDTEALRFGRLRMDPIPARGTVHISTVSLVDPSTENVVWHAAGAENLPGCLVEGSALFTGSGGGPVRFYAIGSDVRLFLPEIPDLPDTPLRFEAWIRVSRNLKGLGDAWREREAQLERLTRQVGGLSDALENQRKSAGEELAGLMQELGEARREIRYYQDEAEDCSNRLEESEKRVEGIWRKVLDQDERVVQCSSELSEAEHRFSELQGWFVRLADILGFDETTASTSVHLVKKSSKVFSRNAPIDEIQTVFRNVFSMLPAADAKMDDSGGDEEEERGGAQRDDD